MIIEYSEELITGHQLTLIFKSPIIKWPLSPEYQAGIQIHL